MIFSVFIFRAKIIFDINIDLEVLGKNYTNILSNIDLRLINQEESFNYSFTDALEEYLLLSTEEGSYYVIVDYYDNYENTSDDCFESIQNQTITNTSFASPSSSTTVNSINSVNIERAVVVNYNGTLRAYTRFEWDPIEKENMYLFNDTELPNSIMYPAMQTTFDFADEIFNKNGYNIFEYQLIPDQSELDEFTINTRDIFFSFISWNTANAICSHLGITTFLNGTSLNLYKPDESRNVGCQINYTGHDYQNDPYSVGRTLAHETLHALTLKGARLLGIYNLTNKLNLPGGHFNHKPNLISDGLLDPGDTIVYDPETLNPYEEIIVEARYLMHKFLFYIEPE